MPPVPQKPAMSPSQLRVMRAGAMVLRAQIEADREKLKAQVVARMEVLDAIAERADKVLARIDEQLKGGDEKTAI